MRRSACSRPSWWCWAGYARASRPKEFAARKHHPTPSEIYASMLTHWRIVITGCVAVGGCGDCLLECVHQRLPESRYQKRNSNQSVGEIEAKLNRYIGGRSQPSSAAHGNCVSRRNVACPVNPCNPWPARKPLRVTDAGHSVSIGLCFCWP